MKVLIDLDRALAEGKITQEEHVRLQTLGSGQTSDLALNILIGFGVLAVTASFLALFQSSFAVLGTGSVLAVLGLALILYHPTRWRILGDILLVVGSALVAGGLVFLGKGSIQALLAATTVLAAAAVLARNGLLAALAVLVLSASLGARSGYMHATYMIGVQRPTLTVVVFTLLAIALVAASKRLPDAMSRLALIAARTSALLVNLGFWIGSLWGDRTPYFYISREVFTVLWALALAGAAVWAWRENRRWPLITATVFAAIHFYTQWFERLGANPLAVLMAGLIAIAIGMALKTLLAAMPRRSPA
jgi:iron complex transport system permease protein